MSYVASFLGWASSVAALVKGFDADFPRRLAAAALGKGSRAAAANSGKGSVVAAVGRGSDAAGAQVRGSAGAYAPGRDSAVVAAEVWGSVADRMKGFAVASCLRRNFGCGCDCVMQYGGGCRQSPAAGIAGRPSICRRHCPFLCDACRRQRADCRHQSPNFARIHANSM